MQPVFQHLLDTYASETSKVISVWGQFSDEELSFRPHARSSSVLDIFKHQLLSERRFFGEFMGLPEPAASEVLAHRSNTGDWARRMLELARPRLTFLALQTESWWLERVPFFDVERERIWIFWRRVLHTAHHRTQLTVYLRLLGKMVPATYGPTADLTWGGADPTQNVDAASASKSSLEVGHWKLPWKHIGRRASLWLNWEAPCKNAWIPVSAVCDGRAGLGLLAHGNPRNFESLAPRCIAQDGPTGPTARS